MKRLVVSCWLLVIGGWAIETFACTGFYVGKAVSADGTTMIGRTVDAAPWNGPMREARFERGEWTHADGTLNKYAFICACMSTSLNRGFRGGGTINEKGVMLSATVTARTNDEATNADPFVSIEEGGYGEENLPDLMIGNAATAREAVEMLGEKIKANGHSGPEIYMVADTNEAWYVEVYTGHEWAAVRMPEDQVAVFGNQFNICEFDTNDTENVMYSPGLVSLAVENGFDVWKDKGNGIIDLYETYSPSLWDYANYRTFWGHNAWAPMAYPSNSYLTATHYELFFTPEKKIALTDVFELMRTRYEGVNCPEENEDTTIRVIGTTKQMSCHVLQMRHDLPEVYRCTLWECLAQAEHSTFLPVCMAMKEIPDAYSRDQELPLEYDPNRAADAFLRLDTLAELKRFIVDTYGVRRDVRACYGAGVRAFWHEQEERLVEEWPKMLEKWMIRGKSGCTEANAYVNFNQVWTLADAKRLHDELAWYWAEFNCDLRDGGGATDVPTYDFASSMPTNAELGASWTRWHRAEFDSYIEELAGPVAKRSSKVSKLVEDSKQVFDGVKDAETLASAKTDMAEIVRDIALYCQGPLGSESNPWESGESVVVWTNGTGVLVFEGEGRTDDYAEATPWAEVMSQVMAARVAETVTLGANSLKGIVTTSPVNGIVLNDLFAAVGGQDPAGAISPAEFERVKIEDGKALLDVSVYTADTIENPNWSVATNGVITVPAEGKQGFFYLMSKPASSNK